MNQCVYIVKVNKSGDNDNDDEGKKM